MEPFELLRRKALYKYLLLLLAEWGRNYMSMSLNSNYVYCFQLCMITLWLRTIGLLNCHFNEPSSLYKTLVEISSRFSRMFTMFASESRVNFEEISPTCIVISVVDSYLTYTIISSVKSINSFRAGNYRKTFV